MQEKLQEAFYNFDDEKQGYLSIDDLRYIVTSDGNPLTGADLEEFLQEADIFKMALSTTRPLRRCCSVKTFEK